MAKRVAGGPLVFNIPTAVPFADAFAACLIDQFGGSPDQLADLIVLLPNRRAIRALRDSFLQASGGAPIILPEMHPLGEVDDEAISAGGTGATFGDDSELPPPISEIRRLAILTRLIDRSAAVTAEARNDGHSGTSVRLAQELARLMDQVETGGLTFDGLAELVPDQYSAHWQRTIEFLKIVTEHWPKILEDEGVLNPAEHRSRALNRLAQKWSDEPPDRSIIAAGSTGSIPATAKLLGVIARLPRGQLVLPGLDTETPNNIWDQIKDDHCHPQFMLAHLLNTIGVGRGEVEPWPLGDAHEVAAKAANERIELVRCALQPAAATASWRTVKLTQPAAALDGVRLVECPGPREEAAIISMILREALETPGKRAALITPDRALARRVRSALDRWGLAVDDSGGTPLALTPAATFLGLLVEAVTEDFHPVALLSLLKHPFSACGLARGEFLTAVRLLEVEVLRGPRPAPGLKGLKAAARSAKAPDRVMDLIAALFERLSALEEIFGLPEAGFSELLSAHLAAAEALADTDSAAGASKIWRGEDGEALAAFVEEAGLAADEFGAGTPGNYPGIVGALLAGRVIRHRWGGHPRLHIWGTLEARMQSVDLVVLGGLNEGAWPPAPPDDPWMSRPMRKDFGLPPLERRVGQSAHDFVQAFGTNEVVMTRSKKSEGAPTVPSRWLSRLHALAGPLAGGAHPWLHWAHGMDDRGETVPLRPPQPKPPVEARPTELSVTAIQEWMRDPYALYARRILKLKPLRPLDEAPGAADRGIVMHRALEKFIADTPESGLEGLLKAGADAFDTIMDRPAVWAFWWPRFQEIARAFILIQEGRRETHEIIDSEIRGNIAVDGTKSAFRLIAMADRIDRTLADGHLEIIDYKTGAVPTGPQIRAGYAPQMPLEGVIAEAGGFKGIAASPVSGLSFWQLQGGDNPVARKWPRDIAADDAIRQAGDGLRRLIDVFADARTPYLSKPRPAISGGGDFDHLARIDEWLGAVGDEGPK